MSTIRATYVQHGSSAVPNITLNASGQVIVASGIVSSGTFAAPSGNVSAPGIYFNGDSNTGLYSPAADTIAFTEGGVEALRIDSSGRVGIGTSNPVFGFVAAGTAFDGSWFNTSGNVSRMGLGGISDGTAGAFQISYNRSTGTTSFGNGFRDTPSTAFTIDSSNRLGVGTTSPARTLDVNGTIRIADGSAVEWGGVSAYISGTSASNALLFYTSSSERFRCDSSGRLLVGTSSARTNVREGTDNETPKVQFESATNDYSEAGLSIINNSSSGFAPQLWLGRSASDSIGGNALVSSGRIGSISFNAADGTNFIQGARIQADIDGTSGSGDLPTRLVFSTTADGASSPTERMRISANGNIQACVTSGALFTIGTNYNSATGLNTNNGLQLLTTGAASNNDYAASVYAGAGDGVQPANSALRVFAKHWNGSAYVEREVFSASNNGSAFFPQLGTTASAANAFLDSGASNRLLRSTSSLRYKTDIEDLDETRSAAILDFRPVWYRSTADADRKDWSWYGLIAEEVAEIEPRLVHWTYIEDAYEEVDGEKQLKPDAEMVPDGVQYDRLTVLLLDVVKRQQQAIETLEAKVAALESA